MEKIQSQQLRYWEDEVAAGKEKAENTAIMQPFWDENEDSVFQFVMSLLV